MRDNFTRGLLPPGVLYPRSMAAERVELPYEDPFDFDEVEGDLAASAEQAATDLVRDTNRRRALQSRRRRARAEAQGVSRGLAFSARSGNPLAMVSPLVEDDLLPPAPEVDVEGLLPIFEPMHNAREIAKQLVLLEDHLVQPAKHCPDCIRKHLLTAEALAEEAVTLDKTGQYHSFFVSAARNIRTVCRGFLANHNRSQLQQQVRKLRKSMSKSGFAALDVGSAQRIPVSMGASVPAAHHHGSMAKVPAGLRQGALVAFRRGSRWYPGRVLPRGRVYQLADGTSNRVDQNPTTDRVVIGTIPFAGYTADPDSSSTMVIRPENNSYTGLVIPLHRARISNSLRGKRVPWFSKSGDPNQPESLNNAQLFMADLIQAVVRDSIGVKLCRLAGVTNLEQLDGYGCREAAGLQLARAAVVTAWYESRLDPTQVNLSGSDRSYGLFQLNRKGGLGVGHSPSRLLDPAYNISVFTKEVGRVLSSAYRGLIRREASLQPTTAGEWTRVTTVRVQRPYKPEDEAHARAETANMLFPSRPAQQVAAVSIIKVGMHLNTDLFAQEYPDVWSFLEPSERRIRPIIERRVPPGNLNPAQVEALREAAQAWGNVGKRNRMRTALMRGIWLARYSGDLVLYRDLLEYLSVMASSTIEGAEARRLLEGLHDTVPASEHSQGSPLSTAVKAGVALGLTAIAFTAIRDYMRTY